ncbi:hypothetical protein ACU686_33420 [Yinghuangia aomiensis]
MGPTAESAASEDGAAAHGAPDGAAEPFRARDGSLGLRAGTAVVLDQYGTVLCATHDAAWLLGRSLGIAEFAQYSAMPTGALLRDRGVLARRPGNPGVSGTTPARSTTKAAARSGSCSSPGPTAPAPTRCPPPGPARTTPKPAASAAPGSPAPPP